MYENRFWSIFRPTQKISPAVKEEFGNERRDTRILHIILFNVLVLTKTFCDSQQPQSSTSKPRCYCCRIRKPPWWRLLDRQELLGRRLGRRRLHSHSSQKQQLLCSRLSVLSHSLSFMFNSINSTCSWMRFFLCFSSHKLYRGFKGWNLNSYCPKILL